MIQLKDLQKIIKSNTTTTVSIVIIVLILLAGGVSYISNRIRPTEVESVFPPSGSTITRVKGELVSINFNKKLSNAEKNNIKVSITPTEKVNMIWKNNRTIVVENNSIKESLKVNQQYKLEITNNGNILQTIDFATGAYSALTEEQQFDQFKEGQESLHKEELRILQERPWVANLPIKDKKYIVYWSDTDTKLYAQLYIKTGSLDSTEKKEQVKKEIVTKLKEIGINTDAEIIEYQELNI